MTRSSTPIREVFAAAIAAALLSGCDVQTFDDVAGSLDTPPADPPADPPSDPPADPPPDPPSGGLNPVFSEIQASILTPNCASASCHGGGNPAAELALDAANSYASLVGIASSQQGGILRVAPGNPDDSYLVQKLEGTAATGNVMPPSGGLPQATIDVVRQWITDGAVDDRVASASPVKLMASYPAPGAVLAESPGRLILGFDRELNAASVDANTVVLESTGADGSLAQDATRFETAAIAVVDGNPSSIVIDLQGPDLGEGSYRVRLSGGGGLAIEDLAGNALDGNADGEPGGDHELTFEISPRPDPVADGD